MARRGKEQPEDEAVEEGAEEAQPAATEFVP